MSLVHLFTTTPAFSEHSHGEQSHLKQLCLFYAMLCGDMLFKVGITGKRLITFGAGVGTLAKVHSSHMLFKVVRCAKRLNTHTVSRGRDSHQGALRPEA